MAQIQGADRRRLGREDFHDPGVQINGNHGLDLGQQRQGEGAEAGADFEDLLTRPPGDGVQQLADNGLIVEKVLAKVLPGPQFKFLTHGAMIKQGLVGIKHTDGRLPCMFKSLNKHTYKAPILDGRLSNAVAKNRPSVCKNPLKAIYRQWGA